MINKLLSSIFGIIEYITEAELTNTSKQLIKNYYEGATQPKHADKARYTIQRYTQTIIPTLDELRDKAKASELAPLDHLILKMEYLARSLDELEEY